MFGSVVLLLYSLLWRLPPAGGQVAQSVVNRLDGALYSTVAIRGGALQVLHASAPVVLTVENVLSPEICAHIIELASPQLKRAMLSGAAKGFAGSGRTNRVRC